jgi:hypothetical protein
MIKRNKIKWITRVKKVRKMMRKMCLTKMKIQQNQELELEVQKDKQNEVTISYPERLEVNDKPYVETIKNIFERV